MCFFVLFSYMHLDNSASLSLFVLLKPALDAILTNFTGPTQTPGSVQPRMPLTSFVTVFALHGVLSAYATAKMRTRFEKIMRKEISLLPYLEFVSDNGNRSKLP